MESKAYPGEFFFFIRVNELLHGLGGRFGVNLGYLDALRPYAEQGLRESTTYNIDPQLLSQHQNSVEVDQQVKDGALQRKLQEALEELEKNNKLVGGQVCILDKRGSTLADVVKGNLGGLKSHIPMTRNALILGYSTTKAVTATLAHCLVEAGYLSYDEPISERVWTSFCPTPVPPVEFEKAWVRRYAADATEPLVWDDIVTRWKWKRQITLRHLLNHTSGLWSALPCELTVKSMASCEYCYSAYEYNSNVPERTLLPTSKPGETCDYHFLSFGWLVAGTICGAYAVKHGLEHESVKYEMVYNALLAPKLSTETKQSGFEPLGCFDLDSLVLAETATSDIRASQMVQKKREMDALGEDDTSSSSNQSPAASILKTFAGKEFLVCTVSA